MYRSVDRFNTEKVSNLKILPMKMFQRNSRTQFYTTYIYLTEIKTGRIKNDWVVDLRNKRLKLNKLLELNLRCDFDLNSKTIYIILRY